MPRPICLIDQPEGIGDIIFIQKIVDRVISDGYEAVLPVVWAYRWLADYIQKPHLTICLVGSLDYRQPDMYLPLANSGFFYPHMSIIVAKYQMMRMNYDRWQDHFTFKRYPEKEKALLDKLGLLGQDFNLISRTIKTPPNQDVLDFGVANGLENVYVSVMEGFTPFDWAVVFEQAANIYMVDGGFTFIAEKLQLRAEHLYLLARNHSEGGVHESLMTLHLFTHPWKLVPVKGADRSGELAKILTKL